MRLDEFTLPAGVTFEPFRHLSPSDVTVDSLIQPSVLCVHLKSSKTDTTGAGVDIFIRRTYDSQSSDGSVTVSSSKGFLPRPSVLLARWLASYSASLC